MSPLRREVRAQFRLALPVVVVQVGLMAMGVVDTAMMGRHSADGLAATAMGNGYWFVFVAFGLGTLMALDPLISQAFGARDERAIALGLQRGIVLALSLSVPLTLVMFAAEPVLQLLRQPAGIIPTAADYVITSVPGIAPFLVFVALRQTLQALHHLRSIVIVTLAANLANVGLNWLLIFGNQGFPELGAVGSALASVICRWLMVLGLVAAAWPVLKTYLLPLRPRALAVAPLLRMLALGMPIGTQFVLEVGAFWAMALFMGMLADQPGMGPHVLAGHQVTMTIASFTFMVPLGVSAAAAVRVGRFIGERDFDGMRRAAAVAIASGALFMVATAAVFVSLPQVLGRLFAPDLPETLAVATLLIPIAGAFQVFDGVQVLAGGVLRGTGDTRWPMFVHVTGFWFVAVPLGAWLAFRRDLVPTGPWWGMAAGLGVVAAVLLLRVRRRLAGDLARLQLDDLPLPEEPAAVAAESDTRSESG